MLLLATVVASLLASAPDSSRAVPNDQIIVNGQTERTDIDKFVAQLAPPASDDQLGKFLQPICPGVVGLPTGLNELVAARMRQVARAVDAPVAPDRCDTNMFVIVVHDKRRAIEDLRKKRPDLLSDIPSAEVAKLKNDPGRVAAWQVIGKIGAEGMALASVRFGRQDSVPESATVARQARVFEVVGRLRQSTVPQFLTSVVMIEARALDGVTTRQLADYALMRGLAPIRERSGAPPHSILALLSPNAAPTDIPQSVTWWDVAFLKSVYGTSNAVSASLQRSAIAGWMKRELHKVPPEER
jgi:hypothetical protein